MRLFATLVPPPEVVAELQHAVASVKVGPQPPGRRKIGKPVAASGPRAADQLDLMPATLVQTTVAVFGNLTALDARSLTDLITQEAAAWDAPRLRLAGGEALVWPGDTGVWSRIEGDLESLERITGGVVRVAERLSLFVDRRRFHPLLPIGAVNDTTDGDYLEALVAALERFVGTAWVQPVLTLAQGVPDASQSGSLTPYAAIRLGG